MRAYPANAKKSNAPARRMPCSPPSKSGPIAAAEGSDVNELAMTTARLPSPTATIRWVSPAVFRTPRRFTAVSATTAPIASGRAKFGAVYSPKVRAIAAQLAVLPITKPQPARNPQR